MLPMRMLKRTIFKTRRCLADVDFKTSPRNVIESCDDLIVPGGKKTLKVAILGSPNAGKSTLINRIVGQPVLCVSKKVHTTRKRERAAVVRDNAQILFLDTPGLVSRAEIKKFQLEPSFREGVLSAMREANIVGVVHDASNTWTRHRFDNNVLEILSALGPKEVFLVLNKVDAIKSKPKLLDLVRRLTSNEPTPLNVPRLDQLEVDSEKKPRALRTWSNFSEIFMLSALKGDGVPDLVDYLFTRAQDGKWFLPPGKVTDRSKPVVLQELVRGRLLDALPEEVPYSLKIETEYFHANDLGEIISVVLVTCPIFRHQKMLLAGGGRIIRQVAKLAEADARDAFRTHVRLRIVVTSREDGSSTRTKINVY